MEKWKVEEKSIILVVNSNAYTQNLKFARYEHGQYRFNFFKPIFSFRVIHNNMLTTSKIITPNSLLFFTCSFYALPNFFMFLSGVKNNIITKKVNAFSNIQTPFFIVGIQGISQDCLHRAILGKTNLRSAQTGNKGKTSH